jgi:release factor glutamine methyltransferase
MHGPELRQAPPTIGSLLRRATADLRGAGVATAGNDARRLMAAITGLSDAQILSRPERMLTTEQVRMLGLHVARRQRREPITRILGETEFYGRRFAVSCATLDPRSDSETLITAGLELVRTGGWPSKPLRIVDVGTGTGCLLLTLLAELTGASGLGTDISAGALATASHNAERLGLGHRVTWRLADALEGIEGPFDLLVSNPPYIRSADIDGLDSEVRDFDPRTALDGGADGLHLYRRLAARIPIVVPNGWIVLEVGYDQADLVAALLVSGHCGIDSASVRVYRDVAGRKRCVAARTRN